MTTVAPSPPLPLPMPSAPLPVAVVLSPPQALAKLVIGALLDGTISQQDAKGIFQVQSSLGSFIIKSALPFPQGAKLSLQVNTLQPQMQFQVLNVNGKAPAQVTPGGQGAPQVGQHVSAGGAARTGAPLPAVSSGTSSISLTEGGVVTATLIRVPQGQAGKFAQQSVPTMQTGPGGSSAAIQGQQSTQARPMAPQTTIPTSSQKFAAPQGTLRSVKAPVSSSLQVGVGSQVSVKVVSIQPPPSSGPLLLMSQGGATTFGLGQTLHAVVTGATASGSPIVMTGAGELTLAARDSFPRGTSLLLQVSGKPTLLQAPLHAFSQGTGADMFVSRSWLALNEAMGVLSEGEGAVSQQLINNVMPQPNSQLAANILFFLSALRGGNILGWLGNGPGKILQNAKPGLFDRLKDDFNTLGRMSKEPTPVGDWRISLIPFFNGAALEQIRMMTRQHGADDEGGEEQESTRFIIDVELTTLGRLQLDGLLRNKGKYMDLIVRTVNRLPEKMRNDIRTIFQEASELTRVQGGITFQATPPNFIEVSMGDIADEGGKDGLIV